MFRVLPRDEKFFVLFSQQAEVLQEASKLLVEMLELSSRDVREHANSIKALEHRGDTMTHDIITRLNQTFITPLDREDIHALSSRMDDVLDLVDAAATRVMLFKLKNVRPPAIELAHIIQRSAVEIVASVPHILEEREKILDHCQELNRLEHESDTVCRNAIAQLFDEERDPIELIKWKEMYEVLEAAVDKAEDVADVLESIVLKSS